MTTLLAALLALAAPTPAPADTPTEAALRRHIAVLASDAFEGRKPGTAGETRTVGYIAAQMRAAGLRPGATGGGWYQPVRLVRRAPVAAALAIVRGRRRTDGPDEMLLVGRDPTVRLTAAPIVFAGRARDADLGDVDLHGAFVLYRTELPKGEEGPTSAERRRAMIARGAAAVVGVSDSTPWARVVAQSQDGTDARADEPAPTVRGAASATAAQAILAAAGAPRGLYASSAAAGFRAVRLKALADATVTSAVRLYASYNVVGLLPGRDPRDEAVAFTAHWDHLGLCRPAGAPDRICNGAVDNASGVAMLIETARGLAADPPQRDALFVATTAEEMGLLGAEAFASDPPRPLAKIVAALNLDTGAITDAGMPVAILGRGVTPALDRVVDEVAAGLGRKVDRDAEANVLLSRQDGWALGKRGLASVMIGGSFSDMGVLERYLEGDYHSPTDDMAHLPTLAGAAEDVTLHVAVGRALGDPKRYPAPVR